MTLLSKRERIDLIDQICCKFHPDGSKQLEIVGHFEKYTPLFHFRITKPCDKYDSIFITDLFGDINIKPGLMQRGIRAQYQGNYNGLSKILVHGIHDAMIKIHNDEVLTRPAFRLEREGRALSQKDRENFDNSLKYINYALKAITPETRRFDVHSETFSSTHYIYD